MPEIKEIQNIIKKGCKVGRPYPWCSKADECNEARVCWFNEAKEIYYLFLKEKHVSQ